MTIQSQKRDACTGTCSGKLSTSHRTENDEIFAYVEITERLMTARTKPPVIEPTGGCGDKNLKLPMRKSLFAHVPPYIIFRNNKRNNATLPREITKHLLWWHRKNLSPRAIQSTIFKSGFTITTNPNENWSGTWCSRSIYSYLRYINKFGKINHFPGCDQLSNKIQFWRNFQRMKKRHGSKEFDFVPLTFVLPEERSRLRKFTERNGVIWIVKPPTSCAGHGIKIVARSYVIPDDRSLICQLYISRPKLIDGFKFDIRLYVLVTSIDPLRIYVYKEGLVRLATIKYSHDVSTLSEKFMHLTNTSVNKLNPKYKDNDDPCKCEGNMWSLSCLWKYLRSTQALDTSEIWKQIKDIVIKTVISAESSFVNAQRKTLGSKYNFYQLFGFDILLDEDYRPWLLEVNDFPSMECDTPLCETVKGQLAKNYLSIVGFHVPNVLTAKELKVVKRIYGESDLCYNEQLYSPSLRQEERRKQYVFMKSRMREVYLKSILKSLTPNDVRVLIRHEDELTETGDFEKIFPTCITYKYFRFFNEIRYYNLLLDAWENEYVDDRMKGIERLRKLCKKKYHLS